ncbi:MAG: hypothetical protein DKT66_23330 [Candidatus Melainabacteria bacterium]|nr:MAG: hypothetical protein DKT66_23330 [Candidatus Melainabacteria bacterium]
MCEPNRIFNNHKHKFVLLQSQTQVCITARLPLIVLSEMHREALCTVSRFVQHGEIMLAYISIWTSLMAM